MSYLTLLELRSKSSVKGVLACSLLLGLNAVAVAEPALNSAATQAEIPKQEDEHAHHHHHEVAPGFKRSVAAYTVPAVTLVDQHDEQISLPDLLKTEKPVLLNFIYTSCTAICPVLSTTFQQVQQQLGEERKQVLMVSVSIDPEYDTPAALAKYAQRFSAGSQWQFLTGSLDDSIAVQQAFGSYRGDKMNHEPVTFVRKHPGDQWVRFDGFTGAAELVNEFHESIAN